MSDKSGKKPIQTEKPKRIMFKCQFCGENKPLLDLIMLRQYYPVISACKDCAKGPRVKANDEQKT